MKMGVRLMSVADVKLNVNKQGICLIPAFLANFVTSQIDTP